MESNEGKDFGIGEKKFWSACRKARRMLSVQYWSEEEFSEEICFIGGGGLFQC